MRALAAFVGVEAAPFAEMRGWLIAQLEFEVRILAFGL